MVTQIDVVRYNVALLSARIYQLKADVKKWADVEITAYRHKQTGQVVDAEYIKKLRLTLKNDKIDGDWWFYTWIDCKMSVRKVVEHINPRHKRWSEYKGLKREATLNLLALRRLKSKVLANYFAAAKRANVCQVDSSRCKCSQVTRKLARIAAQIDAGKRDFSDVAASVREPVVTAQ